MELMGCHAFAEWVHVYWISLRVRLDPSVLRQARFSFELVSNIKRDAEFHGTEVHCLKRRKLLLVSRGKCALGEAGQAAQIRHELLVGDNRRRPSGTECRGEIAVPAKLAHKARGAGVCIKAACHHGARLVHLRDFQNNAVFFLPACGAPLLCTRMLVLARKSERRLFETNRKVFASAQREVLKSKSSQKRSICIPIDGTVKILRTAYRKFLALHPLW